MSFFTQDAAIKSNRRQKVY